MELSYFTPCLHFSFKVLPKGKGYTPQVPCRSCDKLSFCNPLLQEKFKKYLKTKYLKHHHGAEWPPVILFEEFLLFCEYVSRKTWGKCVSPM
jgi:hypothetical protein